MWNVFCSIYLKQKKRFVYFQGSLHNISNFKSQTELQNDVEKFGSLPRVDEDENEVDYY